MPQEISQDRRRIIVLRAQIDGCFINPGGNDASIVA
jgi:hypothetical protein